jgi:hypothetical protein
VYSIRTLPIKPVAAGADLKKPNRYLAARRHADAADLGDKLPARAPLQCAGRREFAAGKLGTR